MHHFMENENMDLVYAEVELINGDDLAMVRRKMMDEDEVKRVHVTMLVHPRHQELIVHPDHPGIAVMKMK